MTKRENNELSCVDCGMLGCEAGNECYPDFCLTTELDNKDMEAVFKLYDSDEKIKRIALAASEVEAAFYCKYTRVQEILEFSKRIGVKKIGIATCFGLIEESRIFARIARLNGYEVYGVACKVGSVEKNSIGIGEEYIRKPKERMCNPILQAKLLNKHRTDINVVIGLCVGHDSLFYKYSKAICTTLITKDRVLGHNPVAALYTAKTYYKKLFEENNSNNIV